MNEDRELVPIEDTDAVPTVNVAVRQSGNRNKIVAAPQGSTIGDLIDSMNLPGTRENYTIEFNGQTQFDWNTIVEDNDMIFIARNRDQGCNP